MNHFLFMTNLATYKSSLFSIEPRPRIHDNRRSRESYHTEMAK